MKQILATIQPHMRGKVISALHELPHFPGVTILKCQGQGRGKGKGGSYVVTENDLQYVLKERLEIVCNDELVEAIIDAIVKNAHTGNHGDGVVTVSAVLDIIRIRIGERGESVL